MFLETAHRQNLPHASNHPHDNLVIGQKREYKLITELGFLIYHGYSH